MIHRQDLICTLQNQTDDVSFSFVDQEPVSGEVHYYARVQQADGQMAWSSPILGQLSTRSDAQLSVLMSRCTETPPCARSHHPEVTEIARFKWS